MRNKIFTLFVLVLNTVVYGQLTVSSGLTPNQYVQNNLIGPGVTVSNVVFNNSSTYTGNQIGAYNYTGSQIPFASGLILSSGGVNGAIGPNSSGGSTIAVTAPALNNDVQLNAIAGFNTNDVGKLEFDFIPVGNTVSFSFLFGSEEYDEYVCGSVNDVFGFFVNGPNPLGGNYVNTNLALVPSTVGTTNIPISINTVNNGNVGANGTASNCSDLDPNWQANSTYFAGVPGSHLQADGMTQLINIQFDVVCGATYNFKFAVADGGDASYDSWVFLQDDSFTSPPVNLSFQTANGTDTIPEACVDANILFIRPTCQSTSEITVDFSISGTAIDDVDFIIADSPITLLAGQDTAAINIAPIIDGLAEGTETIIITVSYLDVNGNPQSITGTLYLTDIQPLAINETDLTLGCFDDSIALIAIGTGGSGVYTYDWELSNSTTMYDTVSINQNGTYNYLLTITDICLGSYTDTVTVIMDQTLAIDSMWSGPATCEPIGWVSGFISGQTGVPQYTWNGPGATNPNSIDASVWEDLSSGWYYLNISDDVCDVNDSVFVDILNPPNASFTATPTSGCSPLQVTFTNDSENASNYAWDFGNGQTLNINNTATQYQTYTSNATIRLIASQGNCADTAYVSVSISICGCTNPISVNYNPMATVDDGSCIMPIPTVDVPNVLTPNNDGSNDLFYLTATNSVSIELTILNRWGNVVYESIGINPAWNGKTQSGIEAPDGVYFFKYRVNGYADQFLEGHGFLHLIR